jgi:hypothetical protein
LLDGTWRVYYQDRLLATLATMTGPPQQRFRRRRYSTGPSRKAEIFNEQLH